ncbi:Arc family DNA-binding protein [Nitratireductor luteus]|uniref:Arc family DNA-binding protein n=1 Tax=Nitratireductor luteus TaxID=2976980 RepID=UPI0022406A41|nr:Arc family DNA-binding protein [Nitratireductor luteus]
MIQKQTDPQFKLRFPPHLKEAIERAAQQNNRSMNAEIIARLEQTIMPTIVDRLQSLLKQINESRPLHAILPSVIAERIGEESATRMEKVFEGLEAPTFELLDRISAFLGVRPSWLKHGLDHPFPVTSERWLGIDFVDRIADEKPDRVLVVRSRNDVGNIAIVLQIDDVRYSTRRTMLHASDHIGAGGERDLAAFSNACCRLSKRKDLNVSGLLLDEQIFTSLVDGSIYPRTAIQAGSPSHWFEDWWDPSVFRHELIFDHYWPGFKEWCERIYQVVQENKQLRTEREKLDKDEIY